MGILPSETTSKPIKTELNFLTLFYFNLNVSLIKFRISFVSGRNILHYLQAPNTIRTIAYNASNKIMYIYTKHPFYFIFFLLNQRKGAIVEGWWCSYSVHCIRILSAFVTNEQKKNEQTHQKKTFNLSDVKQIEVFYLFLDYVRNDVYRLLANSKLFHHVVNWIINCSSISVGKCDLISEY